MAIEGEVRQHWDLLVMLMKANTQLVRPFLYTIMFQKPWAGLQNALSVRDNQPGKFPSNKTHPLSHEDIQCGPP